MAKSLFFFFENIFGHRASSSDLEGRKMRIAANCNLFIFCYKEFEKLTLCKSVGQSEVTLIVCSDPIVRSNLKTNFHNGNTFKM